MILLTFQHNEAYRLGVKTTQGILDLAAANQALQVSGLTDTPAAFYAAGLAALPALEKFVDQALCEEGRAAWLLDEGKLTLGPCLPQPGKIICIGLNYRNHARESNMPFPPVPVLFAKFQNAIAAPGEPVPLPRAARKYDYEAELAVV
ncbi:MAG: fumarylacetoacetate hydrolase family protein, partial [Anaerolineaceae bacterium]|nr:fumarylacetoacetate hydrolase family protein [Anaerolineaceae bacterium]